MVIFMIPQFFFKKISFLFNLLGKEEMKRLTRKQEVEETKLIQEIAVDLELKLFEAFGKDGIDYLTFFSHFTL